MFIHQGQNSKWGCQAWTLSHGADSFWPFYQSLTRTEIVVVLFQYHELTWMCDQLLPVMGSASYNSGHGHGGHHTIGVW